MIVAAELGTSLRSTSGPAIERAGDLVALLTALTAGEVLFLDEIHRIARPAEELLYAAMEDFRVDVVLGKGPGATAIPLDVAPFTLVGATTRAGLLTGPLRDRFGSPRHMDFYEAADLERVLHRSAGLLGVALTDDGAEEVAGRSRGTPRIANRLLRRVRDFAEVRADGVVTRDVAQAALARLRRRHAGSGPVGPGGARGAVPQVRRRSGGSLHAGRGGGGGAGHGRGGRRTLPGARGVAGAHAAGSGRDAGRLVAPRSLTAGPGRDADAVRRVIAGSIGAVSVPPVRPGSGRPEPGRSVS